MSTTDATHDYTTGVPRHHHSLYLADGNFVIQAENAIFKVHRSVLAKYSSVIEDMLNAPQGNNAGGGKDEKPLMLVGDSASGWELLLGWRYESPIFSSKPVLSSQQSLSALRIAHKYCMERLEGSILEELNGASTTAAYVDLMVAAQVVGSDSIYEKALRGLIASEPKPNLEQAKRIGIEATHSIMMAIPDNLKCRHCPCRINWQCGSCRRYQE